MICRSAVIDPAVIEPNILLGSFWHFIDNYKLPGVRCCDLLHFPMDGYSADFPQSAVPFLNRHGFTDAILARGYVAHFQFKSEEDFLRRWRRGGFPNSSAWRDMFETGEYRSILALTNAVYDTYLAEYWHQYTAPAMRFGLPLRDASRPYENVALNKPSWQSSIFEPTGVEPVGGRVSGGGNNGLRNGVYGFHTKYEAQPWWTVDLLTPHYIHACHIYNRRGEPAVADRASELDVLASTDGENWDALLSRTNQGPFGLDGAPLVLDLPMAGPYRFIMLRLRTPGILHLDEVEVYGQPAEANVLP